MFYQRTINFAPDIFTEETYTLINPTLRVCCLVINVYNGLHVCPIICMWNIILCLRTGSDMHHSIITYHDSIFEGV